MRTTQSGAPRPLASSSSSTSCRPAGSSRSERTPHHSSRASAHTYRPLRYLGRGSFGVVLLAEDVETGEAVAIKRVRYDPRLHNREVAILTSVLVERSTVKEPSEVQSWSGAHHPNVVELKDSYVSYDSAPLDVDAAAATAFHAQMTGAGLAQGQSEFFTHVLQPRGAAPGVGVAGGAVYAYLEMVMGYLPMDLHRLKRHFYRHHRMPSASAVVLPGEADTDQEEDCRVPPQLSPAARPTSPAVGAHMPLRWVKVLLFQLARALAFLHAHHVCHRDLKPANVLVDPDTGRVQLCDFGSAKQILQPAKEKNVSYICSRYYRAPELLFGALHYGCEVDMWSFGCLLAELLRESGRPLFRGCTSVDQMAELFKVMGAPSQREMYAMNPQCAEALLRTHAMHHPHSLATGGFGAEAEGRDESAQHNGFMDEDEEEEEEDAQQGSYRHASVAAAASSTAALRSHRHRRGEVDTVSASSTAAPSAELPVQFGDYYDVLKVRAIPWRALFPPDTPREAVDLVAALLCYAPVKRLSALEVVEHAFFDELFAGDDASEATDVRDDDSQLRMPNGRLMPLEMFQITATERALFTETFQAKMARQAERIAAAMKAEEKKKETEEVA